MLRSVGGAVVTPRDGHQVRSVASPVEQTDGKWQVSAIQSYLQQILHTDEKEGRKAGAVRGGGGWFSSARQIPLTTR